MANLASKVPTGAASEEDEEEEGPGPPFRSSLSSPPSCAAAPYDPREYQPPHPDDCGGTMTYQWQACFLSLTVAVLGLA